MAIFSALTTRFQGPPEAPETVDWATRYRSELPHVLNYFRYRVGDPALAEDLTATTFEKAWASRDKYRDAGKFPAWLMTIARNVAIDHSRTRREHLPLEAADGRSAGTSVEQAVERQADADRLRALLQQLPESQRELLALKYGAELTNRHIARITGLTESNVGTTLHRLVQQLRARWEAQP
jgi:RNA polymerase sigma-70 factor, ECF subfamily